MKLWIADGEVEYLELFTRYIRNSEYADKVNLHCFSKLDALQEAIFHHSEVDVLLVSPELAPADDDRAAAGVTLLLLEESSVADNAVYKYQPLHRLMGQVMDAYYSSDAFVPRKQIRAEMNRSGNTRVVSIFSASGGAGKTTFAYHYCKMLAQLNVRVCYLNMEQVNSTSCLHPEFGGKTFADLAYYVKSSGPALSHKLDAVKQHNPEVKVDYVEASPNLAELEDVLPEDAEQLIASFRESGSYDVVVLDLDFIHLKRVESVLQECDTVYWLFLDEFMSVHKTDKLLRFWKSTRQDWFRQLMGRTQFVLNKSMGQIHTANSFIADHRIQLRYQLPYVPDWKLASGKQSWKWGAYSEYIAFMCRDWKDERGHAQHVYIH